MTKFDDSQSPYNDKYSADNRYSKVLFRGGRVALNWELLELQSMQDHQVEMLGDTLFQEGDIISGMDIVPVPTSSSSASGMPNSFALSSLEANYISIDTGTYTSNGNLVVTNKATLSSDIPNMQFTGTITKGLYTTLSFTLQQTSGKLIKFGLGYDTTALTPTVYTIDGTAVSNAVNDLTTTPLVDSTGTQFTLSDGKVHTVVITFKTLTSGSISLDLNINPGSDSLATPFVINVGNLYIEDGKTATSWQVNSNDVDASSTVNRNKSYTVTSGRVWLEGSVREFDAQTVSIMGTGTETLGVSLSETVITSSDNPDLLDTTNGSLTNGMPGADRTKYVVNLTYNDSSSTPIAVFQDNKINADAVKPTYSTLSVILAKRTDDQSGSFRVSGFETTIKDYNLDDSKVQAVIDAGTAYVRGYAITTTSSTSLLLDKSFDTATATNEGYIYNTSDSYITLSNQPVQQVSTVTGQIEGTNNAVVRSTTGIRDQFSTESVYRIVSVSQGTTTYQQGVDFVVANTNYLIWGQDASGNTLNNATIPKAGTSYTVTYDYNKNLVSGTDYEVATVNSQTVINFASMSGLKPIPSSVVNVTYIYFLARIDMIKITSDQSNPFVIQQGTPAPLSSVTPPVLDDPYTLELGYVLVYPNSDTGVFTMQTVTNIPFSGLQKWSTRLDNLEYNQAVQELSTSVSSTEDPVSLRGVFSDSFSDVTKADTSKSDFSVAYDFENGEISISPKSYANLVPDILESASSVNVSGSLVTAPYTEETAIIQNYITDTININEYQVFNVNGTLNITPSSDNWIDTDTVTVQNNLASKSISLSRWWWHLGTTSGNSNANTAITETEGIQGINYNIGDNVAQTGYIISSGGTKTVESVIEYMRENVITFTASNFLAYEDNFSISIEGTAVLSPTPASATYTGTKANTFKADGNGVIKGSFTIPGGVIKCGSRSIVISSDDGSQASAIYIAQGTLKTTEDIINKQVVSVTLYDPLAQSFTLANDRYLTSLKLYFASKPTVSDSTHTSDVIVQIRELSDTGYPNRIIKAETTLTPDDITVSTDGTQATSVVFDSAVSLSANQGYCIVLISDSNAYYMYKATKGSNLVGADTSVLQGAPNSNGVLFTSNNAQTWVADPSSSLKFEVDVANFSTTGEIVFNPITLSSESYLDDNTDSPISIDKLALLTSYLTPSNTGLSWYIRVLPYSSSATIDTMSWEAIAPSNDNTSTSTPGSDADAIKGETELLENSKQIQLKADFSASKYISPILTTEDLSLVGVLTGTQGIYYSINSAESDSSEFSHVKAQFDAYIPAGTSVTLTYSVDGGTTWYTFAKGGTGSATPSSTTTISSYFTRYVYETDVPTAVDINHMANQVKFKLDLESDTNFITPRVRKLATVMSDTL